MNTVNIVRILGLIASVATGSALALSGQLLEGIGVITAAVSAIGLKK